MRVCDPVPSHPARPPAWQERLGTWLLFGLAPRLQRAPQPEAPSELAPHCEIRIPRPGPADGALTATWYPAPEGARGAVLLLHPWVAWGKAYFHRGGRIEALRAAGYHVLAPDLPGFGDSGKRRGFPDRDVEACLGELQRLAGGLSLHVWGVSAGGYWAHPVLSRTRGVSGAVFEDVSPHLLEWSWRMAPWGRPFYAFYRFALPAAYRFLDLRRHAPAMGLAQVLYVSGSGDRGVRPDDTAELAHRAGGEALVIDGAAHLGAIKVANDEVLDWALRTFERASAPARAEPNRGSAARRSRGGARS
jgi:pimeloyl-ACP methyl ester carboxylesterase